MIDDRGWDYVHEKLRGAASDCNVRLEPDQVRYIASFTIKAYDTARNVAAKQPSEPAVVDEKKHVAQILRPLIKDALHGWIDAYKACDTQRDFKAHDESTGSVARILADEFADAVAHCVRTPSPELSEERAIAIIRSGLSALDWDDANITAKRVYEALQQIADIREKV